MKWYRICSARRMPSAASAGQWKGKRGVPCMACTRMMGKKALPQYCRVRMDALGACVHRGRRKEEHALRTRKRGNRKAASHSHVTGDPRLAALDEAEDGGVGAVLPVPRPRRRR